MTSTPRRDTTIEKLAGLKVLHPEIEGFSITAGNSSGTNDAAAAVALVDRDYATANKLNVMATVKAWAAAGVPARDCGLGALAAIEKVLKRAGLSVGDVALWESTRRSRPCRSRPSRSSASTRRR